MAAQLPGALVFQLSPKVVQWMDGETTTRDLAEVKKGEMLEMLPYHATWYGSVFLQGC